MKEEQAINGLPKGWKWEKLGKACEVITGTTPPKSDSSNYGNDIPFFKPPHLWDGIIDDTDERLSLKGSQKARTVPPNTVLVTCIGNLGRTGFVKKKAAFNQQLNAILENENIIGKYIFYQAQSPLFKKQLEKLATGTTVSIVNKGNFETIEIPIPPKETQQQIVSKIEELFSELDKGIEELKTAQQQLKVYRQAVLKWAFDGKLTHEDVKDGELPEGWKLVKLSEVAKKITDGEHFRPQTQETGIPFLSAKDVRDNGVSFEESLFISEDTAKKALLRCNPKRGDILIVSRGATVGRMCIVKTDRVFCLLGSVILVKPKSELSNEFLTYILKSPQINRKLISISGATAQQAIYLRDINQVELPLPPLEEQQQIVQEIENRLSVCDKIEETITDSLKQAEALRQSILKKAFEGKII
jgi:type I restriction enzyme, S subunit